MSRGKETCPICGERTRDTLIAIRSRLGIKQHRCKDKVLIGLNATMSTEEREQAEPSFNIRLNEGFRRMLENES